MSGEATLPNQYQNSRLFLLVLIIALLVHLGMMMVLVMYQETKSMIIVPRQDMQKPLSVHAPDPEQQFDWVNRKAANNRFGAPVVFYDEPEQADDVVQEENLQEQETQEIATQQQSNQQEKIPQDREDELKNERVMPQSATIIQENKDQSLTDASTVLSAQTDEHTEQDSMHREIHDADHLEKKSVRQVQQKKPTQKRIISQQRLAPQKQNMDLAHLVQGFLNYAKEESGDALVEVRGGRDGRPTDEQLKHERYRQKIAWWLQREFHAASFAPHELPEPPFGIKWDLRLNRDGSINDLILITSSGNQAFDERYARTIRAASCSFPPVPSFFKGEVYSIRFYDWADDTRRAPRIKITGH